MEHMTPHSAVKIISKNGMVERSITPAQYIYMAAERVSLCGSDSRFNIDPCYSEKAVITLHNTSSNDDISQWSIPSVGDELPVIIRFKNKRGQSLGEDLNTVGKRFLLGLRAIHVTGYGSGWSEAISALQLVDSSNGKHAEYDFLLDGDSDCETTKREVLFYREFWAG